MTENGKTGLNRFDVVYYINLEHRKDRLEEITNELKKTNINENKITRIDAYYNPHMGTLGCTKSHIAALEHFLNTSDELQHCIVFEDDFVFTLEQDIVNKTIDDFFTQNIDYDVLMLSANIVQNENTEYPFLTKILDAQTTAGYCVNKKFVRTLLANFNEAKYKLETEGLKHDNCFDIHMKLLQSGNNWYCLNPKIGMQRDSYSDIEKKIVSYNC